MNLFQIIFLSVILILYIKDYVSLKNASFITKIYKTRWYPIYLAGFVVIAFPNVSNLIAHLFGIQRGADFVLYVSVLWLFYTSKNINSELLKQSSKIDKLVRSQALKEHEKQN